MGRHMRSWSGRLRAVASVFSLTLVLPSLGVAAPAAVGPLRTVSSEAAALRVAVADLQPVWAPVGGPDAARYGLAIDGFGTGGEPGSVQVPVAAAWILVPPGTRPVLSVVEEAWRDAGGRPLALVPVPVTRPDGKGGGELVELAILPGGALPPGLLVSDEVRAALDRATEPRAGAAARLGEVTWWRGRRVAPLSVVPLRHDGAGLAQSVLSAGTWEVRFVPDKAAPELPSVARHRLGTAQDDRFAGRFLNPEQLRAQPSEAAWRGLGPERRALKAQGGKSGTLLAPEVKLAVRWTRLYRVTAARLRAQRLLPDVPIQESEIRLYQRRYLPELDDGSGNPPWVEIEVPIHLVGEGDAFDGDDFFVFYGLRLRDDGEFMADLGDGPVTVPGCGDQGEWANEFNVYWLAASEPETGADWARMATTSLPASAGQPLANYRRTDHIEEQLAMRERVGTRLADRLYLNHHKDTSVSVGISGQWAPDPVGNSARIEAAAASYTNASASIVRRVRFDLVINDTNVSELGPVDLRFVTDRVFGWDVPAPLLAGQSAKIAMTKIEPEGSLFSYLNWVTISYDALYRAVGGEQKFHSGDAAGARPIEVTGFGDADLGLVEISDPRRPVWVALTAANILGSGSDRTLSILPTQAAADQPRTFWATDDFAGSGVGEFSYYDSAVAVDPVNPTQLVGPAPDLLVVTHADFRSTLDRWINHRKTRSGGALQVHTVDVADIYDWYGGGLKSHWAIKHLVEHALAQWGTWSLVTVGDANENQRGLKVSPAASGWSTDWVPTHYHVQNALAGEFEFMATDKWYVTEETGDTEDTDNFPISVRSPWTMLTGRLLCNSPAELDRLIDKIIAVETPTAGQTWRRRGIFFADDAFSSGYGAEAALTTLEYRADELQFGGSERDSLAPWWTGGTPVALEANLLLLDTWLTPLYPGLGDRPVYDVREDTKSVASPPLRSALSQGALVAHYQGHANANVLSTEYWFDDRANSRRDVALLSNTGKPWVFFGMGCHISDWAQMTVIDPGFASEPSLSEKLMVRTAAGASATYGSSGYEYIFNNRVFGERIFGIWIRRPPAAPAHGGAMRSRWQLGELLWAAEAEHLAANFFSSIDRDMVAQYVLLGDPLMMLDAGPPQVTAVLEGSPDQEISGTFALLGTDPANLRTLRVAARDEAGIDRLRVIDSNGIDLTDQVVVMADSLPPGQGDQQEVHYRLQVPVRPYPHSIDVEVWDTGAPLAADPHWTLTLDVGQEVEFLTGGEPVDPVVFTFAVDVPVDFQAVVTSAAWLDESTVWTLTSENLELSNVLLPNGKTNTAELSFTATAVGGSEGERSVVLGIDGAPTVWVLQADEQVLPDVSISRVYSFPNPMADNTRFLFESGAAQGSGTIRVFSTAGRVVARIPFSFGGGGAGVVEWNGRDDEGDELANGTYLYRVEMDAPGGRVTSPVQRLVVMR